METEESIYSLVFHGFALTEVTHQNEGGAYQLVKGSMKFCVVAGKRCLLNFLSKILTNERPLWHAAFVQIKSG
jgi:hypothetical protein